MLTLAENVRMVPTDKPQEAPLSEPDTVRIMARIPVEVGIKLANIATEQDRSLSSIIRLALREWCERHEKNDHPAD